MLKQFIGGKTSSLRFFIGLTTTSGTFFNNHDSEVSTVFARQMAAHSSLQHVRKLLAVQRTKNRRGFVAGGVNPTSLKESLFKSKLLWM
jgi:hypothetical protein